MAKESKKTLQHSSETVSRHNQNRSFHFSEVPQTNLFPWDQCSSGVKPELARKAWSAVRLKEALWGNAEAEVPSAGTPVLQGVEWEASALQRVRSGLWSHLSAPRDFLFQKYPFVLYLEMPFLSGIFFPGFLKSPYHSHVHPFRFCFICSTEDPTQVPVLSSKLFPTLQ